MADDFDFGFSAVSTDEFKKTQTDTEPTPSTGVSSDEFNEFEYVNLGKQSSSNKSILDTLYCSNTKLIL